MDVSLVTSVVVERSLVGVGVGIDDLYLVRAVVVHWRRGDRRGYMNHTSDVALGRAALATIGRGVASVVVPSS